MQQLSSLFGSVELQRLPINSNSDNLQAWDAADELLLNHLSENQALSSSSRILIINDSFGALSCSLNHYERVSWSDSFIAHSSTEHNTLKNKISNLAALVPSTESPTGKFDYVIIKLPKTLALLEHQLIGIQTLMNSGCVVIAGGMVKYMQTSHFKLFEQYLGATHTTLAKKKARLVFAQTDNINTSRQSPYPISYFDQELQLNLKNHANVFAREKLDLGTRFLLEQFDQLPEAKTIIDLGCGDGVVGIIAQQRMPNSTIYFSDESYMAVASAKGNYQRAFDRSSEAVMPLEDLNSSHFFCADCLTDCKLPPANLILCNPPFHQSNVVGDHIAWRMLTQSKHALASGGQLWVVGNRHLNYHHKLKRLFGNCKTIASNKKFVVLSTLKN